MGKWHARCYFGSIGRHENAANVDDHKTMTNTVMDLVRDAFEAGWDAAIGYCMQPEEEVPAGTAIPNGHKNNNSESILAGGEGKVNAGSGD